MSSSSPVLDPRVASFLAGNKTWAESGAYKAPVKFLELQKRSRGRPDGTVIVVTCGDPRLHPEQALGIGDTGAATIVRTAGGRVHPAMSTLLVLAAVGNEGKKGLIMVIHHTDCGLSHITDEEIRESLKKRGPSKEEEAEVQGMQFGCIKDPEETVREDVELLRKSSFFKGTQIVGLVQDTETGLVRLVVGVSGLGGERERKEEHL